MILKLPKSCQDFSRSFPFVPPPASMSAYYLPPPPPTHTHTQRDAHSKFLHNDLLCNDTCLMAGRCMHNVLGGGGGGGGGGGKTEKIHFSIICPRHESIYKCNNCKINACVSQNKRSNQDL